MQDSIPPAGTVRVVTRSIEESEGHVARVCGLFVALHRSICRAKMPNSSDPNHQTA